MRLSPSPRGLHQRMDVVAHQDAGENFGPADVRGASEQIEEDPAVGIRGKDILAGIASTGYVITGILEPDSHKKCRKVSLYCQVSRLAPIFYRRLVYMHV